MFCSKCGKQIEPSYRVCPYCGAPNSTAANPVGAQPVPPAAPVYSTPAPTRSAGGTDGGMIVALIGAVIGIIALFLPVITASAFGFTVNSGSYINLNEDLLSLGGVDNAALASHILGGISIVLLGLSLLFVLVKLKVLSIIFALLNACWTGFVSFSIISQYHQDEITSALVNFGLGFYGLIIGSLLLLIGTFIMRSRRR